MTRLVLLVAMMTLTNAAWADDEKSEHTANVVGEAADTLGVTIKFDDKTGWSMFVRAKPGATEKTFVLAMPKRHAHYTVYVTPGRAAIVFVETSTGVIYKSETLSAKDVMAWVFSPTDGKLVRSWTYGQVFSAAELARAERSISHLTLFGGSVVTKAGLELTVAGAPKPRTIVLDTKATTLR